MSTEKTRRLRMAVGTALVVGIILLATGSGTARILATMTAEIPFDFVVADTSLSAGRYTLSQPAPGILWIRSSEGVATTTLTLRAVAESPGEQGRLVFNRYGHRHFLAQVWEPGTEIGVQLVKHEWERELLASADGGPETVAVTIDAGGPR